MAARLAAAEEERVRLETLFRTNQVRVDAARAHLAELRAVVGRRALSAYKGKDAGLLDPFTVLAKADQGALAVLASWPGGPAPTAQPPADVDTVTPLPEPPPPGPVD